MSGLRERRVPPWPKEAGDKPPRYVWPIVFLLTLSIHGPAAAEEKPDPLGLDRIFSVLVGASGQDPDEARPPRLGAADRLVESALLVGPRPSQNAAGTEVIPLPNVSYSHNEGLTVGTIVPIFVKNELGEVDRVLAPVLTYNKLFGAEAGAHGLFYVNDLSIGAGAIVSDRVARNFYLEALDDKILDSRFALEVFAKNEVDPSSRFFGFGPKTTSDDETNDTHRETVLRVNAGLNLPPGIQAFWRGRFRDAKVSGGQIPNLPSTPDAFPAAPGIPDATIAATGLEVRWDGRDEAFLPRNGFYLGGVAELNAGLRGATSRYYPRYIVDARAYWTPEDSIVTFAARVRFERLTGSRVPFYEQAILGGRSTLRAYGEDRFTDLASAIFQVEARVTVVSVEIAGARTLWQAVPLFDYGRVFHDLQSRVWQRWRTSPGIGFRLAIPPNILGRLDLGYGTDGLNVFVGLGLPF